MNGSKKITKENIDKLYNLYEELGIFQEEMNLALIASKANGDYIVMLPRKDGKVVDVPESALWDEIYHLGQTSEAYQFLKDKYPHVFEKTDRYEKKVLEISQFSVAELGVDAIRMRLSDIIRIVEGVVDYKLGNKTIEHETEKD